MRSTLLCILFALIIQKQGSHGEEDDEFRPTPIPLNSWSRENLEPAGTLQEFIKTDAPAAVAAIPAHYWEDALRHSVYLTLVRDKIDQLIAKGTVISSDGKTDNNLSKEVDDHDLWEKIKTAPFDRVKADPLPPGDVIILARGRLLEEKDGFRFAEGDEKCDKNNCTQHVKAYWSVKRVRQGESSPGKYHYELTFSVTSQAPKKINKPHETPVRTFTIRENEPTERPVSQSSGNYRRQSDRSQRAIWFHKNIVPLQNSHNGSPASSRGLDRIFSSLFSEDYNDDNDDDISYRLKPNAYVPHAYQQPHNYQQPHAKVGHVGSREQYHQKKVMIPHPMKSQSFRYSRPPLRAPPLSYVQHPHLEVDQGLPNPHTSLHLGNKYILPSPIKPTKEAFLPTPITNFPLLKESTVHESFKTTLKTRDSATEDPDIITTATYKMYNHKQKPTKTAYFSDNIRPPIYNAPPGVFVTMDKKPSKPLPPLKSIHSPRPLKNMPPDFRPSPQILDTSYTDTNSSAINEFRPITLNLTEHFNNKKNSKHNRKPALGKKPSKKHENKYQRLTTVSPDIITFGAEYEDDEMEWAQILGAFTKTTPMSSQREKELASDIDLITTTTSSPTTTTETPEENITTIGTTTSTSTTTTTTSKPRRTRPPHKFTKPEKVRKHKRITTTTTTSTTTSKPTRKLPVNKSSYDLTPQASSAATSGANSGWEAQLKEISTSTDSTSTTATMSTTSTSTSPATQNTTTIKTSTTSSTPSTTIRSESVVTTTQPRTKNRFRQSTLMLKGTSVKHDRWSIRTGEKNRTLPVTQGQHLARRKASKFQGYHHSSTPRQPETERNRDDHVDHAFSSEHEDVSSAILSVEGLKKTQQPTQPTLYQDSDSNHSVAVVDIDDDLIEINVEDEKENDVHDSKDVNEYIFPVTSQKPKEGLDNNIPEKQVTTEYTIVSSPHSVAKNNSKCKKKKHENYTTTENTKNANEVETTTTFSSFTTASGTVSATPSIFDEIFGGFTIDDFTEKQKSRPTAIPEPSESTKHEQYVAIDDDIKDFLHSLDQKSKEEDDDVKFDEEYEEENEDDKDSPFNNEEDNLDSRHFSDEYYDDSSESQAQESEDRPFSLLELMAME